MNRALIEGEPVTTSTACHDTSNTNRVEWAYRIRQSRRTLGESKGGDTVSADSTAVRDIINSHEVDYNPRSVCSAVPVRNPSMSTLHLTILDPNQHTDTEQPVKARSFPQRLRQACAEGECWPPSQDPGLTGTILMSRPISTSLESPHLCPNVSHRIHQLPE